MTDTAGSTTKLWCPVRATESPQTPGPAVWMTTATVPGGITPCCSYCGSINGDLFMKKGRDGWIVEPDDVDYACYLAEPYTPAGLEQIKQDSAVWRRVRCRAFNAGATDDEATAAADAHWAEHEAATHRGRTVAKLNYAHLTTEQRGEFLGLHDSGRMRVGWPGEFYVRPWFWRAAAQESEMAGPVTSGRSR